MKKYFYLILSVVIFAIIHEGAHGYVASIFNEFQAFKIHYYGLEVIFKTPVPERMGMEWGLISGISNVLTLIIGYIAFFCRKHIAHSKNSFIRVLGYWVIFIFLMFDPLNLSLMPFIFGGDIGGIARGFGFNQYLIQVIAFVIVLINRELIIHKLFPLYDITNKHPLFKPIIKPKQATEKLDIG